VKRFEVLGLETVPQIHVGDDLAAIIATCAENEIGGLQDRDLLVVTSKVVSKAAGRLRRLGEVVPGKQARAISRHSGKDARWVQMILDEGHQILAIIPLQGWLQRHILNSAQNQNVARGLVEHEQAICITRGPDGRIHTCDAGIDGSNHPEDLVSLLPEDPDKAARQLRERIRQLTGKQVAVILADTELLPFGTMDLAVGSAGVRPIARQFGHEDLFGRPKFGGMDLVANELASAAALLFGQCGAGVAVVVIRGCPYEVSDDGGIAETFPSGQSDEDQLRQLLKQTLRASSCLGGFTQRLFLRLAAWLI